MINRDVKLFMLKALLAASPRAIHEETLKSVTRTAFNHVAIPAGELNQLIGELEAAGSIAGVNDLTFGMMWGLTIEGKAQAQQIH